MAAAAEAAARSDGIAAEAALNKALSAGVSRTAVAARMGEAQLLQGDLRNAREWLLSGDFSQADAALGWRMTGLLLRLEGQLSAAGQAYDRALAAAPNDPLLWVDIARLRYSGGEHALAVEAAERALSLGPTNPRAIELRAQLLNDQAGPVAAIPLFERGLKAEPGDLQLLIGYAGALGEAGHAVAMLKVARRIAELAPHSPVPYFLQAMIAARAGKIDLARNLLNHLGNRVNQVPAAVLLQSALELEAGNSGIAVNMLERLDRQQPYNQRVQLLYARALLAVQDHPRLWQRFGEAASRPDASPYLLTILGRSCEQTGDRECAAELLDRAATAELASPPVRGPADPVTRPGSFEAFVVAGDDAVLREANDAAIGAYRRAMDLRYPEWLLDHAVYAANLSTGTQLAEHYLAAFPDSLLAPRLVAGAAMRAGDWQRASLLLQNASLRLGHSDPRMLADLAFAQLQNGDAEAAVASAEAAYRLQRASPAATQMLGAALARRGTDPERAASLLDKAERIAGSNPLIQRSRMQLHSR